MGPHGLCVGATGSGKSEMLRTLVLALALTHPPEDLAWSSSTTRAARRSRRSPACRTWPGSSTTSPTTPQLVERAHASHRRRGHAPAAGAQGRRAHRRRSGDYRRAAAENARDLPPLPHLFVVIDEFGELLTAKPEFIDLFLSIGRIGRSIGVHLLLSSQRIEGGKLRGLDTYLSYRLGLRTFSEVESPTVLDTPDAFHLPPLPGYGYLKVDTTRLRALQGGLRLRPGRTRPGAAARRTGHRTAPVAAADCTTRIAPGLAEGAPAGAGPADRPGHLGRRSSTERRRAHPRPTIARSRPSGCRRCPTRLALARGHRPRTALATRRGAPRSPLGLLDDPGPAGAGPVAARPHPGGRARRGHRRARRPAGAPCCAPSPRRSR